MTDVVELTRQLVALDTAGHGEGRAVELLAPLLRDAGFTLDVVEHEPGRGTLIADWATDRDIPPLCLSGHLDTVPLGAATWAHDPFAGELDGDRLYGRGTSDMKGGVAAIVAAACRFARGRPSRAGLRLVFTAAEETGCAGARAAAARLSGRPVGPLVITEPTGNAVSLGHKGALWLSATATGKTAHGSMPHLGDNAVLTMASALTRLDGYAFATEPHPAMGAATLNVGTFHGGLNTNSVPDRAEATIDVRTVAGQRHETVLTSLAEALGPAVSLTPLVDLPSVWTPPENEWVASVADVVAEVTGRAPSPDSALAMPFFTDASVLAPAFGATPTVICGPGETGLAHVTDEWCSVRRLHESVDILQRICQAWCLR